MPLHYDFCILYSSIQFRQSLVYNHTKQKRIECVYEIFYV